MKRRDFIKMTAAASAALSLNGMPMAAFGEGDFLGRLAKNRGSNGNVMVFIQLSGGNDGLNTIIPLDRYSELANARSNIMMPQASVLGLNGTSTTGLHPAMSDLRDLYNQNLVNIVQGVSYPSPNFSHFRATDIWSTASDSNVYQETGWLGRTIDNQFPGAPQAYPDPNFLDPLAIQIGSSVGPILNGMNGINGLALSSLNNFYNIVNGSVDPAPQTPAGHELTFIRFITQQTQTYTQVIQNAASLGNNLATYPASRLAEQLKIVAKLISGGLQTPIYLVQLGGFDTHDNQVDGNVTQGRHADLLADLSSSIKAFQTDLQMLGKDDIVAGCTFSEFGRRIKSNASFGSDHGSGAPMVFFGKKVNPTVIGNSPVLPATATSNDNIPMQHDFRQVYASILQDWLGMSVNDTTSVLNNVNYPTLPIFQSATSNGPIIPGTDNTFGLHPNYPNPFVHHTNLSFTTSGGAAQIILYDQMGRRVRVLYENVVPAGRRDITIERGNLRAGIYYVELIQGNNKASQKLVVQ